MNRSSQSIEEYISNLSISKQIQHSEELNGYINIVADLNFDQYQNPQQFWLGEAILLAVLDQDCKTQIYTNTKDSLFDSNKHSLEFIDTISIKNYASHSLSYSKFYQPRKFFVRARIFYIKEFYYHILDQNGSK